MSAKPTPAAPVPVVKLAIPRALSLQLQDLAAFYDLDPETLARLALASFVEMAKSDEILEFPLFLVQGEQN